MTEAKTFGTLDDADDYVRVNFAQVTGLLPPVKKPSVKRPAKPTTPAPDVPATIGPLLQESTLQGDCPSVSNEPFA